MGFHRDADYISKQFEPYENSSLTVWIALDDADEETGCVEYVPGSHKRERRDDEFSDETSATLSFFSNNNDITDPHQSPSHQSSLPPDMSHQPIVKAKCPAGHAILHHQDVWHGSGPNQSTSRHRRALVAHLLNGHVQWKAQTSVTSTSSASAPSVPPWTDATYIYGRYRRSGIRHLDEDFFPILHGSPDSGVRRTLWLDNYLASVDI